MGSNEVGMWSFLHVCSKKVARNGSKMVQNVVQLQKYTSYRKPAADNLAEKGMCYAQRNGVVMNESQMSTDWPISNTKTTNINVKNTADTEAL